MKYIKLFEELEYQEFSELISKKILGLYLSEGQSNDDHAKYLIFRRRRHRPSSSLYPDSYKVLPVRHLVSVLFQFVSATLAPTSGAHWYDPPGHIASQNEKCESDYESDDGIKYYVYKAEVSDPGCDVICWFNSINGIDDLLGQIVNRVDVGGWKLVDDNGGGRTENIRWTLYTTCGYFDIEVRNTSNGYYGGQVEFIGKFAEEGDKSDDDIDDNIITYSSDIGFYTPGYTILCRELKEDFSS